MSFKLIIILITVLTTVSCDEENSILSDVQDNTISDPVVPKESDGKKANTKKDFLKDFFNKTLTVIKDAGDKWKAWFNSLSCSNETSNFVRCRCNLLLNLNNPDKWRVNKGNLTIPDESAQDDGSEKIAGSLHDWLEKSKKFLIKTDNETQEESSDNNLIE